MDVLTVAATVMRRWYVIVPVLALTIVVMIVVNARAAPQYELRGTYLAGGERLASPGQPAALADEHTQVDEVPGEEEPSNPYRNWDFSRQVLDVLMASPSGQSQIAELVNARAAPLGEPAEQVTIAGYGLSGRSEGAPVARIFARGSDPEVVAQTYDAVVAYVARELDTRQAALGVAASERLALWPLAVASAPEPISREIARTLITIAVIGMAAALSLALLVDNVLEADARRRSVGRPPAGGGPAPATVKPNGEHPADELVVVGGWPDTIATGQSRTVEGLTPAARPPRPRGHR